MIPVFKSNDLLRPEKIHGLVFDGAVFLGNLLLIGWIPTIGDDTLNPRSGVFLFIALVTQITGALIKKGPLNRRMGKDGGSDQEGLVAWFMNFLLLYHFILFTLITLLGLTLLASVIGQTPTDVLNNDWSVLASLVIGALTTYSVWRAGKGAQAGESTQELYWVEFIADGFLWVSVSIVTQFFWGGLLTLIEPSRGAGLTPTSILLLAALSFLFVVFYLPGRYLFFVEDSRSPFTWLQVWVAMLPVAWLVLVG